MFASIVFVFVFQNVAEMTYFVSGGTKNLNSISLGTWRRYTQNRDFMAVGSKHVRRPIRRLENLGMSGNLTASVKTWECQVI